MIKLITTQYLKKTGSSEHGGHKGTKLTTITRNNVLGFASFFVWCEPASWYLTDSWQVSFRSLQVHWLLPECQWLASSQLAGRFFTARRQVCYSQLAGDWQLAGWSLITIVRSLSASWLVIPPSSRLLTGNWYVSRSDLSDISKVSLLVHKSQPSSPSQPTGRFLSQ